MSKFRLQDIDFFVHPPPEKTAVIYRRKTIRGNMLLNVVAAAVQLRTPPRKCHFFFFFLLGHVRVKSSKQRCSNSIFVFCFVAWHFCTPIPIPTRFDDVELGGGKKKMFVANVKSLTHTHTWRHLRVCKVRKKFSPAFHIAELKVFFFRIHRNRISTIFSLRFRFAFFLSFFCFAPLLRRCQNWHERRSKSKCVVRKEFLVFFCRVFLLRIFFLSVFSMNFD